MKLDILIPQYKETDLILKPLLDSIAIQQNINFDNIGIIICNDGSDTYLTESFLSSYPFKISYYKEPHRGVSGTRNKCFEYSTADYVMFCDADDMFYNICGLWMMFKEMEIGFDSMVSAFIEESRNPQTKEVMYITHDMDSTFVHGKIHRRQYLLAQNIRWNENLTIHEDSYFNILCQNLSENVKYCQTPFYLWKWRNESVCRHDPKYILKTYKNMLDSNDALISQFLSRGREDKAAFYSVFIIFDSYYNMNKPEWINQENKEYRNETEKRFSQYFKKYKSLWNNLAHNDKMYISNMVRTRNVQEGMYMEAITINDWLDYIEKL